VHANLNELNQQGRRMRESSRKGGVPSNQRGHKENAYDSVGIGLDLIKAASSPKGIK